MDKEQEVKLQFLDEAAEYLEQIEAGVLGLSESTKRDPMIFDAILRAAHSTKGGAAMMGYQTLSELAHRLEDFFKVIKASKGTVVDAKLEHLLLQSVDCLRHCLQYYRQGNIEIDSTWLNSDNNSLFEQIHQLIGDVNPEDSLPELSEDTSLEMISLLFQTEVDESLNRLENVLNSAEKTCLKEEFTLAAQELEGLAEMLELNDFSALCRSIQHKLESSKNEQIAEICQSSLQAWRCSQALILVGQVNNLPSKLTINLDVAETSEWEEFAMTEDSIEDSSTEDLSVITHIYNTKEEETTINTYISVPEAKDYSFKVRDKESEEILISAKESFTDEIIRVSVKQLEKLSDLVGELTIERNGLNLQVDSLHNLLDLLWQRVKVLRESNTQLRTLYDQNTGEIPLKINNNSQNNAVSHRLSSALTVLDQLEMDRYSDIHLVFQALMETIVQIEEVTQDIGINLQKQEQSARSLTRTSQLLQTQVTSVRMRPFSDLAARLKRAVREMNLKYDKSVELNITGENTLLERTILESINDPLLHLLRNAFDHGIESESTRLAQGKSSVGKININATHRGNQTVITISDDGAGINLEKIYDKALSMGFDRETLAKKNKQELLKLIFEPGFSTAEQVTDLSGRGIGMDIVRTEIRSCQGDILVDTKSGFGTTFTLIVPFSLSVVRVLLVESGGIWLAVPSGVVEEMIIPEPAILLHSAGQDYLNWDGYMIPLLKLNQCFHFARPVEEAYTEAIPVINQPVVLIIGQQGGDWVALEVDSYWGEQEVTIRGIEGALKLPAGFTGCTILGDGRVVPLIDPWALLESLEVKKYRQQKEVLAADNMESQPKLKPTVMVVDDSINVRRFLALTLEKAGYRVQQAKDGQEALEHLQKGLPIQAVICDIEMPRLDGYGFLAHVKSDSLLRDVPVIMLTSRSGEKHRQIAMNLGAKAYFSKPFQEQELLATLKSLSTLPSSSSGKIPVTI